MKVFIFREVEEMEVVKCEPVDYSGLGIVQMQNSLAQMPSQCTPRAQPVHGPIPCPECGKLFAKEFDIKRHMFTHTGEKPFKVINYPSEYQANSLL